VGVGLVLIGLLWWRLGMPGRPKRSTTPVDPGA
jgi:hypothetical protein